MHSTDKTLEIAKSHNAKIFNFEQVGYVEPARQFAVDQVQQKWVLILDADEVVTEKLAQTIKEVVTNDSADLVYMPWLNYMFGRPITACRFEPEREMHLRLFKKGMVNFGSEVHAPIVPDPSGRILKLNPETQGVVWHFNYSNISSFIQKLDRYTTLEAASNQKNPSSPSRILRKVVREVINRYWRAKGYKLGWHGLAVSLLMGFYEATKQIKIHELSQYKSEDAIIDSYKKLAEQEIARSHHLSK